jgi:tRNA pseudouridine synthase 10
VEFGRELSEDDAGLIHALEGKTLLQQTPTRVAHRRADLVRHRKIKHIGLVKKSGNEATLMIKAEAGTYIKELISGDGGRTRPSVAEMLRTTAVCKRLEVVEIDDGFLDFCLSA